jgi:hypothetical protein
MSSSKEWERQFGAVGASLGLQPANFSKDIAARWTMVPLIEKTHLSTSAREFAPGTYD